MATLYSDIYNVFLNKISDYDLQILDDDIKEIFLNGLMKSACTKFKRLCKINLLDRDDASKQFNSDLDDEIINIITEQMVAEWLKPRLYNTENLKNVLNTKDFNQYSSANLLKEIREVYNHSSNEALKLMREYSYVNGKNNVT